MANPLIAISRRQALLFAIFLVLYEFLTYIANDMIMPGMLFVVEQFHGSQGDVARSLTAYVLGGASLQLILGPLSDNLGRRPVMLTGAWLFFLFTVSIALSNSMTQFLWARFFQGMGLCFISVVGYATLQEIFAEMDAVRLIAIMANVSTMAPLIGPVIGAVVIHHYGWRGIFVSIAALALIACWGLWRYMPEPVGQTKTDGEQIPRVPLNLRFIMGNYGKLIKNPAFMAGALAIGMEILPCLAWIALAPIILVANGHLSVFEYGLWQIPLFGACILGNMYLYRISHRHSLKGLIYYGAAVLALGLVLAILLPWYFGGQYIWLLPGLFIYFFSLGITGSPLMRFTLFVTDVSKGTASALMSMICMVVQGLGIEVASWFYHSNSNLLFALFNGLVGLGFWGLLFAAFYWAPVKEA